MGRYHLFWGSLAMVLLMEMPLHGQSIGQLSGTAADPSGSVIVGADVSCLNVATGTVLKTTTNPEGIFRFPDLSVGMYTVTVRQAGFKTLVRSSVEILTDHSVALNLVLEVGGASERVEVSNQLPLVQTDSTVVQTTIEAREMRDLPLNGRNPLDLVALTAGTVASAVGTNNASQENTVGISVNGLRTTDAVVRLDGGIYTNPWVNNVPVLPNPDTLQEFTVSSSNASAKESGAGAVVELATRSGANQFHGTAFEYLRNEELDSRNFFALQRGIYRRNQYGGTAGGPIRRDKVFFFGSYQGTKVTGSPNTKTIFVPTAAMRGGDLSSVGKTINDPLTGKPFPGNIIPTSRQDPLALKVLQYVALPNQSGGRVIVPPASDQDEWQVLGKVDYYVNPRNQLSGRYFVTEHDFQQDNNSFPGTFQTSAFREWSAMVKDTYTLTPRLVFTTSFDDSRFHRTTHANFPFTMEQLGADVLPANQYATPALQLTVSGYFTFNSGNPLNFDPKIWQLREDVSYTRGQHMIQFGIAAKHTDFYRVNGTTGYGSWTFGGQVTGDAFGDFLLGRASTFTQAAVWPQDVVRTEIQPWIQDVWKVTRRLTVNLGLRYEPTLPEYDKLNPMVGFLPGMHSTLAPGAPLGVFFSGDSGFPQSIRSTDYKTFGPRAGLAWDVRGNGRTVVRAAYGIYTRDDNAGAIATAAQPAFRSFAVNISSPASFANPYASYPGSDPFPFQPVPLNQIGSYKFPEPFSVTAVDPDTRTGYTQIWNFTAERQISAGIGVSATYTGNHSVKIISNYEANPAVYVPGATTANTDARRLYQGLSTVILEAPMQYGDYEGLQLSITKRAAHGLSLMANYTYSKTIDNGSTGAINNFGTDPFNLNFDRAVADWDQTHRFNLALVYSLPKLQALHGPASAVLNGWQVNTIFTAMSGLPFSILSGKDNSFSGMGQDRADQIGNPARPAGVDPLREWFNPKAFVSNAVGTFGDSGRNVLRGPGEWNVNFSAFKEFRLWESLRWQTRFEAFNFFNHANFGNPSSTLTGASVGEITTAADPRVIQFAMRLSF